MYWNLECRQLQLSLSHKPLKFSSHKLFSWKSFLKELYEPPGLSLGQIKNFLQRSCFIERSHRKDKQNKIQIFFHAKTVFSFANFYLNQWNPLCDWDLTMSRTYEMSEHMFYHPLSSNSPRLLCWTYISVCDSGVTRRGNRKEVSQQTIEQKTFHRVFAAHLMLNLSQVMCKPCCVSAAPA